jgi:hypothetical protein
VAYDARVCIANAERDVEAAVSADQKVSQEDPVADKEIEEGFYGVKRCPCEFEEIEPCGRMCSCRNPNMSAPCQRCCTVGSPEQQLAKARWLVEREKENVLFRNLLKRVVGPGSLLPDWTLFAIEIRKALRLEVQPKCVGDKWPPLDPGTKVKTTEPMADLRGWLPECLASRRWGVKGTILKHHDSHGLSYEVQHDDGTVGHYDPSELELLR